MTTPPRLRARRRRPAPASITRTVVPLVLALGLLVVGVVGLERGWLDRWLVAAQHSPILGGGEGSPWRPRFSELTQADRELSARQRELVNELARRYVGGELSGRSTADLRVLQEILDRGALAADQVFELQALGVALGDVMAAQLGLKWWIFEDELGRTRVLRLGETDTVIFPTTMISKRVERGVPFSVDELYRSAARAIRGDAAGGG